MRSTSRLKRLPFVGRWRREPETVDTRPYGYDLLGELQHDLDPDHLPPAKQQVAHATLLENLRAIDTRLDVPTLVIAAVGRAETARPVIAGVIIQAHLSGLRLGLGKLVPAEGFRQLRRRVPATHTIEDTRPGGSSSPNDMALRIVGSPDVEELTAWYNKAASGSDLLLIEAPPLLRSVDAALLGRACDGLVLVMETLGTRQEDLETAIDRARAAGSPPVGLVTAEHREWLPRSLRKILPSYPRTVRPRSQGAV